jgi:hypothetical protein
MRIHIKVEEILAIDHLKSAGRSLLSKRSDWSHEVNQGLVAVRRCFNVFKRYVQMASKSIGRPLDFDLRKRT